MDRKMPVRSMKVELDGDYTGWWVNVRTNPPAGALADAAAAFPQDTELKPEDLVTLVPALYDILALVLTSWNFVDENGKDIPIDGLKLLPIDLLVLTATKVLEAITKPVG